MMESPFGKHILAEYFECECISRPVHVWYPG